jgi:GT2 family glycosyltransferase
MHNDARISVEDIRKMHEAARANRGKYYWTVTYNPALIQQNNDIFAIFDTKIYWKLGGHDSRFDFYYADLDLHFRALNAGYEQQLVETPSAVHLNGGSNTRKTYPNKYVDIVAEKDRQIFNMLWPAQQK